METLVQILYVIATALNVPVIVALLALVGWSAVQVGMLGRERLERRKSIKPLRLAVRELKSARHSVSSLRVALAPVAVGHGYVAEVAQCAITEPTPITRMAKLLDDLEVALQRRTSRLQLGLRLGPMLGLMGTLIPMGPALTGLAGGDVGELTRNLVVAFSTTVLGILVGGICFVLQLVRRNWYAQDLSDLNFIHDLAGSAHPKE